MRLLFNHPIHEIKFLFLSPVAFLSYPGRRIRVHDTTYYQSNDFILKYPVAYCQRQYYLLSTSCWPVKKDGRPSDCKHEKRSFTSLLVSHETKYLDSSLEVLQDQFYVRFVLFFVHFVRFFRLVRFVCFVRCVSVRFWILLSSGRNGQCPPPPI